VGESAIISTRPEAEGMTFKWWEETLGSDYLYNHHRDKMQLCSQEGGQRKDLLLRICPELGAAYEARCGLLVSSLVLEGCPGG